MINVCNWNGLHFILRIYLSERWWICVISEQCMSNCTSSITLQQKPTSISQLLLNHPQLVLSVTKTEPYPFQVSASQPSVAHPYSINILTFRNMFFKVQKNLLPLLVVGHEPNLPRAIGSDHQKWVRWSSEVNRKFRI